MKHVWKQRLVSLAIMLAIGVLLLSACAAAAQRPPSEKSFFEGGAIYPAPPAATEAPALSAPSYEMSGDLAQGGALPAQERLVIKDVNLTLIVPDPSISMNNITDLAEELGGFVVTANMYKQKLSNGVEVPRASITIRVPSAKLNQALDKIRAESAQAPENETISSQDVTNEYVDLQSRLKNLEAAEKELTRIMEDAHRTEDVLSVYSQLVSIREQIEVIKGQIKYYEQSAAMSAVAVELIADKAIQPIEIGGWKPAGVVKDAIEALIRAMQGLVNVLIWIVLYILPILLVLVLIFVVPPVLIIRAWLKRRKARKQAEQPDKPAP